MKHAYSAHEFVVQEQHNAAARGLAQHTVPAKSDGKRVLCSDLRVVLLLSVWVCFARSAKPSLSLTRGA